MEVIQGNVYDYPEYYDILFGADWKDEIRFLKACFKRFVDHPVQNIFEPACGTGRLMYHLAQQGYNVSGNDLNRAAVDYCNRRLAENGFPPTAMVGDMSDFRLAELQDAAFNTINSFRHLPDEKSALGHLRCMAEALVSGGIYVLGLHLTPSTPSVCQQEQWQARRDGIRVDSEMWVENLDRDERKEHIAFQVTAKSNNRKVQVDDRFVFRTYSCDEMAELIGKVPEFEIVETYDFSYKIDKPVCVDCESEDIIYVLRKR